MPTATGSSSLDEAAQAVRAAALARLRASGSAALRGRLASGELSAEAFYREVVRDWVRAGVRSMDRSVTDEAYQHVLGLTPRVTVGGGTTNAPDFVLAPSRSSRRTRAGAFYTPGALIDWLVARALDPAIADARARRPHDPDAVLALRVCDPACGSGRFLVAAARRLAGELAADRAGAGRSSADDQRRATRDVVERCVFGVDIDDNAVELCRASLAGLVEEDAASVAAALESNVREGDSLRGTTPELLGSEEVTREGADAWCRGRGAEGRFFHWFVEYCDVFSSRAGASGSVHAAPWRDRLSGAQALPRRGLQRGEGGSLETAGGFDVVLGNPPFLNQLQSGTAAAAGVRALLRARFGGAVRGYADTAAAFVLLALEIVRPGGRVGLVLPRSLLAVEHARPVRSAVLRASTPTALWAAPPGAFAAASVATCAIALHKGGARRGTLARNSGTGFAPLAPLDVDADELSERPSWAHLFADADGIPQIVVKTRRTIGDIADATADFRDQYYGLQGHIVDSPENHPRRPKLITSGLIAPLESLWGRVATRVHKQKWMHPRVDLDSIDAAAVSDPQMRRLAAWARSRLTPKLLLATQTRVLEVLADPEGELLPCVPVITVTPKDPADLGRVAKALSSPVASAVALTRYAGAGLSVDAIKLSAKQVLELPLIDDAGERELDQKALARVVAWWSERAKRSSKATGRGSAPSGHIRPPGPAIL